MGPLAFGQFFFILFLIFFLKNDIKLQLLQSFMTFKHVLFDFILRFDKKAESVVFIPSEIA